MNPRPKLWSCDIFLFHVFLSEMSRPSFSQREHGHYVRLCKSSHFHQDGSAISVSCKANICAVSGLKGFLLVSKLKPEES